MTELRYDASAFDPSVPAGRVSGVLELTIDGPTLTSAGPCVALPWHGLRLRLGGANDRLVFFEHPAHPDTSVFTADHRVLADPELARHPELARAIAGVRSRKHRARALLLGVIAVLLAAVGGLVAAKDPLVGFVIARIPVSVETRLGEAVFSQLSLTTPLLVDPELDAELAQLAAPLLAALPATGYPFRLHLANSPEVNAFAIPGGHVVIHTGLLLEATSAEEVLGVLGHEIAHVTRRHSLRQLVSSAGVFMLVQTFFGDVTGLMAIAVHGGSELLTLRFSRDLEREADDDAWASLLAAGIDPHGLVTFFEKLQAKRDGAAAVVDGSLAFLSTHPSSAERVARLAGRAAEIERSFEPVAPGEWFSRFQDRIRAQTQETGPTTEAVPHAEPERAE
jgi:predicted Zn-dependent protease